MSSLLWTRRGLSVVAYALALAPHTTVAGGLVGLSAPLAWATAGVVTMGAVGIVVPRLWAQLVGRATLALVAIFGFVVTLSDPGSWAAGGYLFTFAAACCALALLGRSGVDEACSSPTFAPVAGRTSFLFAAAAVVANAMVLLLLAALDLTFGDYGPAILSFSTAAAGFVSVAALLRMRAVSVWLSAGAASMLLLACFATSPIGLAFGAFGGHEPTLHLMLWAIAAISFSTIGASLFDARMAFRRRLGGRSILTSAIGAGGSNWRISTLPVLLSRHDLEGDQVVGMAGGQRVGPRA